MQHQQVKKENHNNQDEGSKNIVKVKIEMDTIFRFFSILFYFVVYYKRLNKIYLLFIQSLSYTIGSSVYLKSVRYDKKETI